jgi:hypothetical protein
LLKTFKDVKDTHHDDQEERKKVGNETRASKEMKRVRTKGSKI